MSKKRKHSKMGSQIQKHQQPSRAEKKKGQKIKKVEMAPEIVEVIVPAPEPFDAKKLVADILKKQ